MGNPPKVGAVHRRTFAVTPDATLVVPGGGVPPLLSTPSLILWLELTARDLLAPHIAEDECTVGVVVEVEHLAATPAGAEVVCEARVTRVDGPVVAFRVEARDPHETIARGFHERRVVEKARLARKLERKAVEA
jgi:predicted thioesterase